MRSSGCGYFFLKIGNKMKFIKSINISEFDYSKKTDQPGPLISFIRGCKCMLKQVSSFFAFMINNSGY
jgi:hypothetical protein